MADQNLIVRDVAPSGNWDNHADRFSGVTGVIGKLIAVLLLVVVVFTGYAVIAAPLSLGWQAVFGVACLIFALVMDRIKGRLVSLGLMGLSTLLSARYIYWRLTETLDYSGDQFTWVDVFFAFGLIAAEIYAFLVLLLGYMQTLWPLQRTPVPLPRDVSVWPTVDLYIPTYNEPLSVLRPTIIAASDIDWPKDKMSVIVLDDGRRDELAEMCEELGVQYRRRGDNKHAKAGNINAALKHSTAEYIAIFDCDHVPTRSFLQVTMGWFLRDNKLSMLQTPHHFFSPDPFEKNLNTFKDIPNEGELFYGLLQDGNDLWNATFFCGSCAVIRRTALNEVGGIAVETVTEDAHTSLKMQRRGWSTAYINLPQAAGLATESLAAHIGQRIRWARGMIQIFRIDNPLFGRGLSIAQRLCYMNAMMYFLFGLPRIVFLTAPLAFLLFDARIIVTSALLLAAYALPHLIHSQMTASRLQGPYRYSFWAEVYETVLCVYVVLPTTLALINPKLGSFNVTDKGTSKDNAFYDGKIARPLLILLALNAIGFLVGLWRLITNLGEGTDSLILNLVWTGYNVIILTVSATVAYEQREIRRAVRVAAELPAKLRIGDAAPIDVMTVDLSEGGAMIRMPSSKDLPLGEKIRVAILPEYREVWTEAEVTRSSGDVLAMKFSKMNLAQERQLIYAIFGRADAWLHWTDRRDPDKIGVSFGKLLTVGFGGMKKALQASKK